MDDADQLAELAEKLFRDRRTRSKYFPSHLLGEPPWDILLDLYVAAARDKRVSTSDPALTADIPLTTALRWFDVLRDEGLIERVQDPRDGRRRYLQITAKAVEAMERYLVAIAGKAALLIGIFLHAPNLP